MMQRIQPTSALLLTLALTLGAPALLASRIETAE